MLSPPSAADWTIGVATLRINQKDGARMIFIPGGTFLKGDDDLDGSPREAIQLTGFWIYKNDVTVAQYRRFCRAMDHAMPVAPPWSWIEDHPIVNVSWEDAVA